MKLNRTVVDEVYNKLKEDIINLKIELGTRINIQQISKNYDISQTPVREALSRLVRDGLILYKSRRGYYVIQISCKDLKEIYDLRKMIECYALEKGIKNIDKNKLKEILKKEIKMQKEPLLPKKPPEFCILDKELHMTIVNSLLSGRIKKIYSRIYPIATISQQLDPSYEKSVNEHVLLIEEILEGNTKKAKNTLEKHIENCKIDNIKFLKSTKKRKL